MLNEQGRRFHPTILHLLSALTYCHDCFRDDLAEWALSQEHPGRPREEKRVRDQRARAERLQLPATLTTDEWMQTLHRHGWACAYCNGPFEVMEHLVPLAEGGGTTAQNCVPACQTCNAFKADQHPESVLRQAEEAVMLATGIARVWRDRYNIQSA